MQTREDRQWMPRLLRTGGAVVLILALLGLVPAGVALAAGGHDHEDRQHRTIQITREGLKPDPLTISTEDAVIWVNYQEDLAQVSFPGQVAASLICEAPSNFRLSGGSLLSEPLRANEFASTCRFKPGTYEYQVRTFQVPISGGAGEVVKGKIVVQKN